MVYMASHCYDWLADFCFDFHEKRSKEGVLKFIGLLKNGFNFQILILLINQPDLVFVGKRNL